MNREPSFVINELLGRVNRGELSRRTFVKAAGILGLSAGMSQMLLDGRAQAMQDSGASSGELVIALPRSLISLDPHGAQSVEEATAIVNAHLLDTLTYRDAASGEILPRIAESWEQVDELTWSFTVRSGITFHDGTPVTSADLKASLDRVLELAGPLAPLWATVESTEAPDDQTFLIKTTSPTGTVPTSATLLYITPAAAATDEAFFEAPIGAGPYKFVSWTRDSEMVCEAVADRRTALRHRQADLPRHSGSRRPLDLARNGRDRHHLGAAGRSAADAPRKQRSHDRFDLDLRLLLHLVQRQPRAVHRCPRPPGHVARA
ncbi:MAG: ABC transporter substrate-binding protein [Thermomicrobiales bacterium]